METIDNNILITITSIRVELDELRRRLIGLHRHSEPSRNLVFNLCTLREVLSDERKSILSITHVTHIVVLIEVKLNLMVKHLTSILISCKKSEPLIAPTLSNVTITSTKLKPFRRTILIKNEIFKSLTFLTELAKELSHE